MKNFLLHIVTVCVFLIALPGLSFGQVNLDLGAIEQFSLYSINGAVSSTGTSTIHNLGRVGADIGAISGFPFQIAESGNATTAQAKEDLLKVYISLNNIPVTKFGHLAAFTEEAISPGVYLIPSAGSVSGTVTLNGQGDPNAVFIIKFQGAFSMGAGAKIVLAGDTKAENVYWIAEGASSIGAAADMVGTLIAHPGAVSMGAGCTLVGRMLSTSGAISVATSEVTKPDAGNSIIPVVVSEDPSPAITIGGNLKKFALFGSAGAVSNTGISGVVGDIGTNAGAVSGWGSSVVLGDIVGDVNVTSAAKNELSDLYDELTGYPHGTTTTHIPALGGLAGETLPAGVYSIAAAGTLSGILTLDGDADDVFIFKFGGAFATGVGSRVVLTGGARSCNVFWVAEGAIGIGAFTSMKGTTIANNGANSMGANAFQEGRMFSTGGAVNFNTATAFFSSPAVYGATVAEDIAYSCYAQTINTSGYNTCHGTWTNGNGSTTDCQSKYDDLCSPGSAFSTNETPEIVSLSASKNGIDIDAGTDADTDIGDVILYPNPTHDNVHIDMRGYAGKAGTIEIFNNLGQRMTVRNYQSIPSMPVVFSVIDFTNGMYIVSIKVEDQKRITKKFIVN